MRRIGNRALWIGPALNAAGLRMVHEQGIEALVDLAINEPVLQLTRELIYCRFPLVDGAGNRPESLRIAVETTADLIRSGTPTLVFWSGGMSRSPAIAAAALSVATGASLADCLAEVVAAGPKDLSPALWKDIGEVLGGMSGQAASR
ncbi:MAG TPA: protein phosphatase [Pirellulaceae bacterium]|nr:protein phosphatase [Pirellulaceae bacterium]